MAPWIPHCLHRPEAAQRSYSKGIADAV
ncbi:hypothetical protein MICRO8M_100338 [Microbacterium sp. 8M]|nr:hypothetical protein MICRO8M_100338 [Microbacterium sp. 8M]